MKLRKTLRMFGIIAATLGTLATHSFALPTNEVEITYFSDATYTDEVGYTFRGCEGSVYREGQRTAYAVRSVTPCESNPPLPESDCFAGGRLTKCPTNLCDSSLFACN